MTTATIPESFKGEMRRLLGLRFAPADMTAHYEVLQKVPLAVLRVAVTKAQNECSEFPSPRELMAFASQEQARSSNLLAPDRSEPDTPRTFEVAVAGTVGAKLSISRSWKYYCERCNDVGWETRWCGETPPTEWGVKPWIKRVTDCGRKTANGHEYGHEFVRPCECAETNPEVQRKRRITHQMAMQRTSK